MSVDGGGLERDRQTDRMKWEREVKVEGIG